MLVLTGFYFAAGALRGISISASVCLSVRWHISNTIRPNFTKFSVHISGGPWLGLSLTTVQLVTAFLFVDNVMFSHIEANIDTDRVCNVSNIHRDSTGGAVKLCTQGLNLLSSIASSDLIIWYSFINNNNSNLICIAPECQRLQRRWRTESDKKN